MLTQSQRVRTNRPVTLTQGASRLQAGSLSYDRRTGILELGGRVRGTLAADAGGDGP